VGQVMEGGHVWGLAGAVLCRRWDAPQVCSPTGTCCHLPVGMRGAGRVLMVNG
jgi:hypothetical protein